ncbi:MAG: hypothetical protein COZ69_05760 [Deltaproteobacteria bacterium CG_4_8_14_3_um_filter_45_9]|nr:MAG: hypothetical protein COZ69_05760 [Deltaproteobacteria bacterium CG_4_8_14_3_um_filter_45_9]
MLNDEVKYVQLEKLEDIIKMLSASMRPPPLHHKEIKDGHIYFLPASLALGKAVIYFVKTKEKVEKKYIVLDMVRNKISLSDELSTKPSLKHFSIMEVKAQNILPTDVL